MFDQQFLNLLKDRIVISDVVGRQVRLIGNGRDKVACCPFHKEKTPSFHVNDEKGFYHCFGCGAHGDAITFVMQQDGLSFKEAVESLAEEYGMELPKFNNVSYSKEKNNQTEVDVVLAMNEKACQFFQDCIFNNLGKFGLNYITKRGLNTENIKKFRIGFAPYGNQLMDFLKKNGYDEKQMEKAGLVASGDGGYYDKFRERVIFPVLDKKGRVIAFTGRVINGDRMPKYMNSPETVVYHKSNVLFNYYFARKSIYDEKKAILVEGNLDAIGLAINGVENVVAPMGTAITAQQMEDLWKITDEIVVCLDGDKAGQKASRRLALLVLPMLTALKTIKFVALPEGQDPDDFVKNNGKVGFLNYVNDKNNCKSLSEFLWNGELNELNVDDGGYITPEQKSRLEISLKKIVAQIKNPLVSKNFIDFYRKQLFMITKFDSKNKVAKYRDITKINYKKITSPLNSIENLKDNIKKVEKNIFSILAGDLSLVDKIFQIYNIDIFGLNYLNENADKILNMYLDVYENGDVEDKNFLKKTLENNGFKCYIIDNGYYENILESKRLNYLYGLVLEKNILTLEIEIKELSLKNDDESRRQLILKELDVLYRKRGEVEDD